MFLKKEGTPTSSSSHIFATAKLFDPGESDVNQNGRVKIVQSPQVVSVRGLSPGRNDVVFTNPASRFVDIVGMVSVLFDVKVFFHFLDGPAGIKTNRPADVEAAFIRAMNRIYRGQTAIVFASAGANPSLTVPGAKPSKDASGKVGLPVLSGGRTPEQLAVVSNRKSDVLFNVFLIGDMVDLTGAMSGDPGEDFLGLTSQSDTSVVPPRCCLVRDPQPRDPPGIKWGDTLAHEAGHALDEDDIKDDPRKDHLMFFSASKRTGVKIPSSTAFFMLKSAKKFPP